MDSSHVSSKKRDNQTSTYCLYFLGFMDLCLVSMGLPLVARKSREFGAAPSIVGLIASIYGGIQFFSSPMMGKISDVAGRKKVLLIALVGTAGSYFLVGLSNSLIILALTRVPVGIFKQTQGLCKVSLADITPTFQRPRVFGYFNSIATSGFVIGPLIGGHIGMTEHGFFKVMTLQAIGFIFMAMFAWYFLDIPDSSNVKIKEYKEVALKKSSDDEDGQTSKEEKPVILNDRGKTRTIGSSSVLKPFFVKIENFFGIASLENILDLFLLRFVMGFAMILFRSNFTTMLEFRYHASPKTTGYILSFNGIISGISGFIVGYVAAFYKHDNARALKHCAIVITASLFSITFSPDLWVMVILLVPLSFSTSVSRVCLSSLTLHRCNPNERGVILGVGNSLLSFARMLSPLLAGFAQELSVYGPGSISVVIAGIGTSIAAFIVN